MLIGSKQLDFYLKLKVVNDYNFPFCQPDKILSTTDNRDLLVFSNKMLYFRIDTRKHKYVQRPSNDLGLLNGSSEWFKLRRPYVNNVQSKRRLGSCLFKQVRFSYKRGLLICIKWLLQYKRNRIVRSSLNDRNKTFVPIV